MSIQETSTPVESLAELPAGQQFEVVRVLRAGSHDGGAEHCLRPGGQWQCRYNGAAIMLLVSRTGRTIRITHDASRYIEVRRSAARSG